MAMFVRHYHNNGTGLYICKKISSDKPPGSTMVHIVTIHDKRAYNVNKFQEYFAGVEWTSIIVLENPRMAYNTILLKYSQGYDCFPLKKK